MGYDGVAGRVAFRYILTNHAGYGIGHAMGQVDTAVAESDAGIGGGQQNFAPRDVIRRIFNDAHQVFGNHFNGPGGPDITDGVGSLVGRSHFGVFGGRSLIVG